MPIYPECKFGIDDSINSIIEIILERLNPKAILSDFGIISIQCMLFCD